MIWEMGEGAQNAEHSSSPFQVDIDEAVELSNGVGNTKSSPWTLSMICLDGCLFIGYLCATANGLDGAVMGGINAMTSYQDYFHVSPSTLRVVGFA
ncbi:lactose permease [Penicillium malachiteum]|uniref:lactose permease n=1 Tax=Penicillium malachiteum TaxID=1324776 RepID=UPI0025484A01|nr:lactose permease [Penicillium malachiteum]KAJ5737228.1 lactose permease [Penicillium malachiteum]